MRPFHFGSVTSQTFLMTGVWIFSLLKMKTLLISWKVRGFCSAAGMTGLHRLGHVVHEVARGDELAEDAA